MNERRVLLLFAAILAISLGPAGKSALAATPSFTISASNVTMPASGNGSIPFTLTSVNGYSGTIGVDCSPPNLPAGTTLPACGGSPIAVSYTLTADAVTQGTVPLSATLCPPSNPSVCPVKFNRTRRGFGAGLALAGVLLVGLGFRRRTARWFTLMLLAAGTLAGMAGMTACGGNTLTPGTYTFTVTGYTFTVTGQGTGTTTDAQLTESTTVNVTVPPGIPVQYY